MDLAGLRERSDFTVLIEASTFRSLLESGLRSVRLGNDAEAVAYFAMAHEQLIPNQFEIATILEAFIQNHSHHQEAIQALHEASKRFVEIDAKQQANIVALEQLVLIISEGESVYSRPAYTAGHQTQLLIIPAAPIPSLAKQEVLLPVQNTALPALYVKCLGRFEVCRFGRPVQLCRNRSGQAVLRYLIAQHKYCATMDMLMTAFWPEDAAEVARHKLRVAVSALRCSLNKGYVSEPGMGYILCKDGTYEVNPAVVLKTDVDEFLELYQAGQRATTAVAVESYEKACCLYTGPFLAEDLYADWSSPQRELLRRIYLSMCNTLADKALEMCDYAAAITWANAILKENLCDEEAHRQLLRVYAAQGRRSEALRQYQCCQRALVEELGVQPMLETQQLYNSILNDLSRENHHL